MIRLTQGLPAFAQIRNAIAAGLPLVYDTRMERAGDKAAAVHLARWISSQVGAPIQFIEANDGKTDFLLQSVGLPDNLSARFAEEDEDEKQQFDVYPRRAGFHFDIQDSLWPLNSYLQTRDYRITTTLLGGVEPSDEVVFCLLGDVPYNNRREMDVECAALTVQALREAGHKVTVLAERPYKGIETVQLTMPEAVRRVAAARVVIAGDTGFGHLAALFGRPLVSLLPDWYNSRNIRLNTAITVSEFWEVSVYNTAKIFLPNAPWDRLRVVEIGTNHRWSPVHVVRSVGRLSEQ